MEGEALDFTGMRADGKGIAGRATPQVVHADPAGRSAVEEDVGKVGAIGDDRYTFAQGQSREGGGGRGERGERGGANGGGERGGGEGGLIRPGCFQAV